MAAAAPEQPAPPAGGSLYDDGEFYSDEEESDGEYYEEYETDDELDWDPDRERLIRYVRKTTLNAMSAKAVKGAAEGSTAPVSAASAKPRPKPVLYKQKSIAEELDRTPAEVSKKLEDIRTRYAF